MLFLYINKISLLFIEFILNNSLFELYKFEFSNWLFDNSKDNFSNKLPLFLNENNWELILCNVKILLL